MMEVRLTQRIAGHKGMQCNVCKKTLVGYFSEAGDGILITLPNECVSRTMCISRVVIFANESNQHFEVYNKTPNARPPVKMPTLGDKGQ